MTTIYALIHGASLCWESAPPQQILGVVLEVFGPHACSRASPCHGTVTLALPKLGEAVLLGVAVPMLTSPRPQRWAPVAGGALTFLSSRQTWLLTAHQGARTSVPRPPNCCPCSGTLSLQVGEQVSEPPLTPAEKHRRPEESVTAVTLWPSQNSPGDDL